jgi:hypothetical protein
VGGGVGGCFEFTEDYVWMLWLARDGKEGREEGKEIANSL